LPISVVADISCSRYQLYADISCMAISVGPISVDRYQLYADISCRAISVVPISVAPISCSCADNSWADISCCDINGPISAVLEPL